mmetsp:Transcript_20316/g.77796  ORF Transcript_20316/g.77796 Transcript_20316/m.77796 type:complete len:205 (-) Transcript_20316:663-1277(-)
MAVSSSLESTFFALSGSIRCCFTVARSVTYVSSVLMSSCTARLNSSWRPLASSTSVRLLVCDWSMRMPPPSASASAATLPFFAVFGSPADVVRPVPAPGGALAIFLAAVCDGVDSGTLSLLSFTLSALSWRESSAAVSAASVSEVCEEFCDEFTVEGFSEMDLLRESARALAPTDSASERGERGEVNEDEGSLVSSEVSPFGRG